MSDAARRCGACNFCCKVMEITALEKPGGVWCPYAKPDLGCEIYGRHPAECRAFSCQWLVQPSLAPKYRPDRTKVVLTADGPPGRERLVANCDPANPLAWKRAPIYGLLKQQARKTWGSEATVVAKAGQQLWLITPSDDVDLGVAETGAAYAIDRSDPDNIRVSVVPPRV